MIEGVESVSRSEKGALDGGSKYRAEKLPPEVKERSDAAIERGVTFIVA